MMKSKKALTGILTVLIFIALVLTFYPMFHKTIASEAAIKLDLAYQMAGVALGGIVAILGGFYLERTLSEESENQTRRNSARIIYHDIYNCLTAIFKNNVEGLKNPIFFSKSWNEHLALIDVDEKQKDLITTIYFALEKYNFHFNNYYLQSRQHEINREQKRINGLFFEEIEEIEDKKEEEGKIIWEKIEKLAELEKEVKKLTDKNLEIEALRDFQGGSLIIDEYGSLDHFNEKDRSIKVELEKKVDELDDFKKSFQQEYSYDFKDSNEAGSHILSLLYNIISLEDFLKKDYLEVLDSIKQTRHN